jgi:hypothetical protein
MKGCSSRTNICAAIGEILKLDERRDVSAATKCNARHRRSPIPRITEATITRMPAIHMFPLDRLVTRLVNLIQVRCWVATPTMIPAAPVATARGRLLWRLREALINLRILDSIPGLNWLTRIDRAMPNQRRKRSGKTDRELDDDSNRRKSEISSGDCLRGGIYLGGSPC